MSDSKAFFSVVIPVYNKAPFLDRSINSVINQSFTEFELLLIDDASTDGSLVEIQKFGDRRIRVLHRNAPGAGGYAARNLGLMEAKGDWVAFLDADDEWYPDHLETLHNLACQSGARVVASGWFDVSEGGGERTPSAFSAHYAERGDLHLDFPRVLDEFTKRRKPVWTGVIAAQRTLLDAVGGFPEHCRRGGDTSLWLQLVAEAGGIQVATARTAVYHREASGVVRALQPETRGNCIFQTTQKLLQGSLSRRTRHQLMRVSNLHMLPGLKSRALSGSLAVSDLAEYYFRGDWNTYILFWFHSLLPGALQPHVWRFYQKLKHLV